MERYIDADEMYKKLHEAGGCDAEKGSFADGWDKAIDEAISLLGALPAVDVEPRNEVAKGIFGEIDKLLTRIIADDENGTTFIGVDMQRYYALKKKYIGDEK